MYFHTHTHIYIFEASSMLWLIQKKKKQRNLISLIKGVAINLEQNLVYNLIPDI